MSKNCIIIPYRDREPHLDIFLNKSAPLLLEKLPNLEIYIIEQSPLKKFNRGKLLNIGVKENFCSDTIFFTQDVDTNPLPCTIDNFYCLECPDETIIGIFTSQCNTLGGVIKLKGSTFQKINGFPNDFWGWGREDKALQVRAEDENIKIFKNITNKDPNIWSKYINILQDLHVKETTSNDHKSVHDKSSGLNTLTYEVLSRESLSHFIHKITVDI